MEPTPAEAGATPARGHLSVARMERQWFIGCRSAELKAQPLSRRIQGTPVVVFRTGKGAAAALLDRCPHRNVPLSEGKVRGEELECRYHGWRFDCAGECVAIPGLVSGETRLRSRRAPSFAVREVDGFVWIFSTPDVEPTFEPFRFPHLDDPRFTHARRDFRVPAHMHAVLENTLDVPHTAFLHGGYFRTAEKENVIEVVVRRTSDRVEAEYLNEPRPKGLAGRLLAPRGGVVTHFDRFLLPCIAQVEYRLGESSHLVTTSAHTPVDDFDTRIYVVVSLRLPLPGWLVKPFVTPIATHIFKQDAQILRKQTETIRAFGGERYATTEIDVLGPQIWRLLRHASRADGPPLPDEETRVRMRT